MSPELSDVKPIPAELPGRGNGKFAAVPDRFARCGAVLQLVASGEATTVSQVAKQLSVVRSTAAERLERLVAHGLLVPHDEPLVGRGRPSVQYRFNASAGIIAAAQVGLSGMRTALTDLSGGVIASETVDIDLGLGPRAVLDALIQLWEEQLGRVGRKRSHLRGAGVGLPTPIELATIRQAATDEDLRWTECDVVEYLESRLGLPVVGDQDVNLMALAEHRFAHPESKVLACVKVGTAIGCGLVVHGEVLRGVASLAGEIAHTPVSGNTKQCQCGNTGCLNTSASGRALVERLVSTRGEVALTAREIAALAQDGDAETIQFIRQAGRDLGKVLGGVVNLLNPDIVAIWGYLDDAGDYLLAGVRESIYTAAHPLVSQSLTISHASLGDDAGVRGAALAVLEQILAPEAIDRWIYDVERALILT